MAGNALTVPAVALGTWAWGDSGQAGDGYFGSQLSGSGLREVVEKAQSKGFTLWDTAVAYGMGRSETVLAQALKGYDRSEYQLSTKFTRRSRATATSRSQTCWSRASTAWARTTWICTGSTTPPTWPVGRRP